MGVPKPAIQQVYYYKYRVASDTKSAVSPAEFVIGERSRFCGPVRFFGIYWACWGRAGAIRELRAGSFLIGKWKARGGAQRAGRARQLGKRTGQVIGLTYTYLCSRDVI